MKFVVHWRLLAASILVPALANAEAVEAPGVITSEREAVISTQISAQIIELPFKQGEAFQKDDLLVAFECARFKAEHKEARASLGAAAARHKVNRELDKYGAIGKGEVSASGAETGAAAARAEALDQFVKLCEVRAPFAGRVVAIASDLYETPSEGEPLIEIIDESALVVEVIAPSIWLRWMKPGALMKFEVRETGDILDAEIIRLGAKVDPVSQSIDVVARIVDRPAYVLAGMSGRAILNSE